MSQLSFFQSTTWTVTNLTRYIRQLLESDAQLQDLWVQGEVSNFSRPTSGHLYFTLKDAGASIRCVMWRNAITRQTFLPHEGDAIEAHGNISIYEASGQYQLYIDTIRPAGEGLLYQEFLRLKARLEAEGLFDPKLKQAIPAWPHRIGLVTSPTGAALRDMLNTIQRRFPLVDVILAPTQVQGDQAPLGIVAALESLNTIEKPDVIIVARGGGSLEDLWAFNDEGVARAIAASEIPVITGIGHETDFTIADFTADLRAPTPTAAAELATPDRADLKVGLDEQWKRIQKGIQSYLVNYQWELQTVKNRLGLNSPITRIRGDRQRLDDLTRRARAGLSYYLVVERTRLDGLDYRLSALNPRAVLGRGYAIVSQSDGSVVRKVQQVSPNEPLDVRVSDGQFGVVVKETQK